ncbi:hypothetical protein E3E12_06770 [Formicincola oecophyllae]|uniref:2'-5' RNA ligase n=1 Tax=Formicincola oecophyllae TaxID=2558361 RepID=A0A4Y6U9Q0_9PROT|nr:hypothetical protein [Formicincola oecophyllae]QDH13934.1 hypothetical protein E3E12_06770 [Formicincola oecophyllae]
MKRYTALLLPPPSLLGELGLMRGVLPKARWARLESLHLPLRSFTLPGRHEAAALDSALEHVRWKAFDMTLREVFITPPPPHAPNPELGLEVGAAPPGPLEALQKKVENAVRSAGLPPRKSRWQPRLHLGAIPEGYLDDAVRWMQRHNLFRSLPMRVDRFFIAETWPDPEGPGAQMELAGVFSHDGRPLDLEDPLPDEDDDIYGEDGIADDDFLATLGGEGRDGEELGGTSASQGG